MFGMLESLAKAAAAVVTVPVAIVVDVVTLPASSMDTQSGPFDRTTGAVNDLVDNLKDATRPLSK